MKYFSLTILVLTTLFSCEEGDPDADQAYENMQEIANTIQGQWAVNSITYNLTDRDSLAEFVNALSVNFNPCEVKQTFTLDTACEGFFATSEDAPFQFSVNRNNEYDELEITSTSDGSFPIPVDHSNWKVTYPNADRIILEGANSQTTEVIKSIELTRK
ncbi:hypothetical protein [Tunicatimonas pelagia]|uniref:hypothetical protein n=1 Tax=Tunicatimonas pelagia TaxID=931531 RepID=UPI002666873F|nr:hypothetical protein [Tunicatimonas pelagia]WKN44084.1 hypothetical protein P0M28_03770 [Tunicatimonas pelagia]